MSRNRKRLFYLAALLSASALMVWPVAHAAWSSLPVQSSPAPPCGEVWGSAADRKAIEQAMLSSTAEAVAAAINRAKQTRGAALGCSEQGYSYKAPNFAELSSEAIRDEWRKHHAAALAVYRERCTRAARNWGLPALGGYYARQAGEAVDLAALARIADILEATQYKVAHAPAPLKHTPGMFGYLSMPESDACADKTDIAGRPLYRILEQMCSERPGRCAIYNAGLFVGKRFVVADVEQPSDLDGGGAYDHEIAGVMIIEAALGQTDPKLPDPKVKDKYRAAALLAGEWAIYEPPVRNHNYTAKLVWLLAELYDWTGEPRFRAALLDKLDRDLLPGVLMDADNDGKVDGMNDQPFATLATIA
jgi:hypothetical protein